MRIGLPIRSWLTTANPDVDSISLEGGDWISTVSAHDSGSNFINSVLTECEYHWRVRTRGLEGRLCSDFSALARSIEFLDLDVLCPSDKLVRLLPSAESSDLERMHDRLKINLAAIRNTLKYNADPETFMNAAGDSVNRFKHAGFDYCIHTTVHPYTCTLVDLDIIKRTYIDTFELDPGHWHLHRYVPHAESSTLMRDMWLQELYTDEQLQEAADKLGAVYEG